MSTISFEVLVLDGEGIPVPAVEVGARYRYRNLPRTWSHEVTDGDGCAVFRDDHTEPPVEVCLLVSDDRCGDYPLRDGDRYVLEM